MNYMCYSCMNAPPGDGACEDCNPDDPVGSNYQSVLGKRGTEYSGTRVMCPFYKRILKPQKMIVCEGPIGNQENDTVITVYYRSQKRMKTQVVCYCEGAYEYCELYKLIAQKYEG